MNAARTAKLNDTANHLVCDTARVIQSLPMVDRDRLAGQLVKEIYMLALIGRKSSSWCDHYQALEFIRDNAVQLKSHIDNQSKSH